MIGLLLGSIDNQLTYGNLLIVIIGAILVRSCGCVINDISDHKFDKLVSRTKDRPIAKGEVSLKGAWIFFSILASSCLSLVIFVPEATLKISLFIAIFILIYPLTKRFLKAPQFFYLYYIYMTDLHNKISIIVESVKKRPTIVNPDSKFVVITYWWGRGNVNNNIARPCISFYENFIIELIIDA